MTQDNGLYDDIRLMYLSGATVRSIVKMYGTSMYRYEIINTLDSIRAELTIAELNVRKLNKTKFKLNKSVAKHNVLAGKELEHQERSGHFKTKKLVIEQSIIKLQACIDKLNAV